MVVWNEIERIDESHGYVSGSGIGKGVFCIHHDVVGRCTECPDCKKKHFPWRHNEFKCDRCKDYHPTDELNVKVVCNFCEQNGCDW